MARSGVDLDDKCVKEYSEMKMDRDRKRRCIIYRLSNDNKKIEIEDIKYKDPCKEQQQEYEEIVNNLPQAEGRYVVWDLKLPAKSSGESGKVDNDYVVFMSKCFDECPIKTKMLFASSQDALKKQLNGISASVECKDCTDMSYDDIVTKCTKKK